VGFENDGTTYSMDTNRSYSKKMLVSLRGNDGNTNESATDSYLSIENK